ncbi:MAG: topoisomerase protein [Parcubacteria group bacterium GW2011_GWD2_42_14]|nr:MAG: topoisomerase protein [Parcubacteria group bacterium GW2011_GWD2_42_14]
MQTLVIVESPAKAKTIEKYLGKGYVVKASVGHIRDLPKSNKNAIDIQAGFVPNYEIVQKKQEIIKELSSFAKKSDKVLLATDRDREGEAIAWHLVEALKLPKEKTKRIAFNEITKDAVQEAIKHPREIDQNLRKAQEARRVLDRLVGYDLSGLIWKKVRYGLSAGRVQSPALRILMEREREIRAFIPEAYWVLTANVVSHDYTFSLTCTEEPKEEAEANRIVAVAKEGSWFVKDIKETEQKRAPRPPFTTSTLQQTASTRLGFSPSKTMAVAQKLYEAGHITYMRTDSLTLSEAALGMLSSVIEKNFGKSFIEITKYKTKSKNAQEAHEAIRPTNPVKIRAGSTDEQKRLYNLIWMRTVASQMKSAQLAKTKILANIAGETIPDFAVRGSRVVYDGWLKADPAARGEDVELPQVHKGDSLTLTSIESEGKYTTPPNRYTEAGLVKELEKSGIGRPSTYASIMKNLADRGYVEKQGKTLIPTDTGDVVSSFLEKYFKDYISNSFTADMENELDEIANGTREYVATLKNFYTTFSEEVKSKENIEKLTNLGPVPKEFTCPKCQAPMEYKLGRGGKFMSCTKYPECDGARTNSGDIVEPDKPLGIYPETGEEIFVLNGRFGPYVQVGDPKKAKEKGKKEKPRRASLPKDKDPSEVTLEEALTYLTLPRVLGVHPVTNEPITASVGRFGPYIVHQKDFRSLKKDDVYTITLERALEILAEEKKTRKGRFAKK